MKKLLSTIICLMIMCVVSVASATVRPSIGEYAPDYFQYTDKSPIRQKDGYYRLSSNIWTIIYNNDTGEIQEVINWDKGYTTYGLTVGQYKPKKFSLSSNVAGGVDLVDIKGNYVGHRSYYMLPEYENGRCVYLVCVYLGEWYTGADFPIAGLGFRYSDFK